MKPISGLVEIPDTGRLKERVEFLKNNNAGLGPADLVLLTKKSGQNEFTTYSHFSGLNIHKENDAKDFFNDLDSRIPHKLLGQVQYELAKAVICIWNPFSKVDVRVQVDDSNNVTAKAYNSDNQESEFKQTMWREIGIASTLRYWFPYDQLFRSVYNLPYVECYPLNVKKPSKLSEDDITFISENLNQSNDLDYALALYLLANTQNPDFFNYIVILRASFPRIPAAILHFIPLTSPLADKMYDYLVLTYAKYPEDSLLASILFEMASARKDKVRVNQVLPSIKNSYWSDPISCMCSAKSFMKSSKYEDSKVIANAAFYCREYQEPKLPKFEPELPEAPSGRAPRSVPRTIEKEIIESQLDGVSDIIYRIIFELRESYGVMRLKDAKNYPQPKGGVLADQVYQGNTNNSIESLNSDAELDELYDPGVTSHNNVPQMFYKLPFSTYFFDVLEVIDEESDQVSRLKRLGVVNTQPDARHAAILALKTGDREPLRIALKYFENKKRIRPVHFMLEMALYAKSGGDIPEYKESKIRMTLGERNSLDVLVPISENLRSLIPN